MIIEKPAPKNLANRICATQQFIRETQREKKWKVNEDGLDVKDDQDFQGT